MDAPEELMLDLNKLAEGQKFLGLGAFTVSDDGNWLAYSTDTTGYRQYTLQGQEPAHGRDAEGEHRADGLGRVGQRQQDAVLFDRRSGLEAVRQVLAAHRGQRQERSALRRERRELRRGRGTLARSQDHFRRVLREDVARVPLSPRRRSRGTLRSFCCRARRTRVSTSITTTASSTSPRTAGRRTSGSSRRRSPIRRRRTGSRSSTTIPRSRSTASRSSPATSSFPSAKAASTTCA